MDTHTKNQAGLPSLRELAQRAFEESERERIESWRFKSSQMLQSRLISVFCVAYTEIGETQFRDDGTAFTVADGILFEAPENPHYPGLTIVDGDHRIPVLGLIDLGRYLKGKSHEPV